MEVRKEGMEVQEETVIIIKLDESYRPRLFKNKVKVHI